MSTIKKSVAVLLSFVISITIFSIIPLNSFAENSDIISSGDYKYRLLQDSTAEITEVKSGSTVIIPDEIDGYPVTGIDNNTLYWNDTITELILGKNIKNLDGEAFQYCGNLAKIYVDTDNIYFSNDENGVLFNKDKTKLVKSPEAFTPAEYTIPNTVKIIGRYAFAEGENIYHSEEKQITISENVTTIEDSAFSGCNTKSIVIPDNVKEIGEDAFGYCRNLKEITIGDGVKVLPKDMLRQCSALETISFGNNIEVLADEIWGFDVSGHLTNISLGNNIAHIDGSFPTLNNGNVSLNKASVFPFTKSHLEKISISDDNEYFCLDEYGVLYNKDKTVLIKAADFETETKYIIPDSVKEISEYAFFCCKNLTEITIPDSIEVIKPYTFNDCADLEKINISNSLETIGDHAFTDCTKLISANLPNTLTTIGESAFSGCSSLISVNLPNGINTISASAFADCSDLQSVNLPDSLTTIGESAFNGCNSLVSVNLPNGINTISASVFADCTGLQSVNLPDSLITIGESAFSGCKSLTSINLPNGINTISASAFADCTSLQSVNLPDSLTAIGESAFMNCNRITQISIPESITNISASTFKNCTALTSVVFPDTLKNIGDYAFYGCSGLTEINLPDNLESIGSFSFVCKNLKSVTFPKNIITIGNRSFGYYPVITNIFNQTFESAEKLSGFTVYGTQYSEAERYAVENSFLFIPVENEDTDIPSDEPTTNPSDEPSTKPSEEPTTKPSDTPTQIPDNDDESDGDNVFVRFFKYLKNIFQKIFDTLIALFSF